jgi:GT2 family glycosyltransferase
LDRPRVAAIVLNYNGREVTLQALASLAAMDYPACDLIVVDNGSTDGSYEAVAAAFPAVIQVRTEENQGPAGGANLGMRRALAGGYDYLLILNNDIEVAADFVTRLVEVAESAPDVGIVGPKGYFYWDRERIWSAGGRLPFREAATKERGEGRLDRGQFDRTEEVDYVNGCAMLVKRRVVEEVGLWDPIYHLSVEDADFCMRAKEAGYRCFYAHRARLWHMVSTSTGGYRAGKTFQTGRSTAIFFRRHATAAQQVKAWVWVVGSLPFAFLRELLRGNQGAVIAKARGFLAGLRAPLAPPPGAIEGSPGEAGPSRGSVPASQVGAVGEGDAR